MVKANAYGHGIERVANALPTVEALGVASLEEGVRLREAGITKPIVLMEGVFFPDEVYEAANHQFTLVVHHLPHVEILENAKVTRPFPIWLKINTGMHRLGIDVAQVNEIYSRLQKIPAVEKPIGLMTHFAEADAIHSAATTHQIELFTQATAHLPGPRSLANSAGILAWPTSHGDWVRPGLMLYGASPFADKTGVDHGLQPVMTLWSELIAITHVKKGGKVGYGGTWEAPEDMLVGVVGVGYGDGYPQFAQNGTPILVNNVECQLVGRVSMDMLTVDLRKQPQAKIGDPVILWGAGLPVERVARHSHTSAYEILTRMTPRPKIQVKQAS
jgi:alanine racemase